MTPISTYASASGQTTYMTLGTMPTGITDNMRIKSKNDVITNSSTEVFIVKTTDLEEFKKEHGELLKTDDGFSSNLDDEFWGPTDLKDLQESWNSGDLGKKNRIREISDYLGLQTGILTFYSVSRETKLALEYFGITDDQIKSYEDHINETKTKTITDSQKFKKSLDWKAMVRSGHGNFVGRDNNLKKFLDEKNYEHLYWL